MMLRDASMPAQHVSDAAALVLPKGQTGCRTLADEMARLTPLLRTITAER
jgi:hypothetical protein